MTPPDPRELAKSATRKAAGLLGRERPDSVQAQQTLTFARPVPELAGWLADPDVIDRVVGDLAKVDEPLPGAFHFTVGDNATVIETALKATSDELLWVQTDDGRPADFARLTLTPAPNDLGTEVRLTVAVSAQPGIPDDLTQFAVGGALLKALHRAKALIETGEIPTLTNNPAARRGGADHKEHR